MDRPTSLALSRERLWALAGSKVLLDGLSTASDNVQGRLHSRDQRVPVLLLLTHRADRQPGLAVGKRPTQLALVLLLDGVLDPAKLRKPRHDPSNVFAAEPRAARDGLGFADASLRGSSAAAAS